MRLALIPARGGSVRVPRKNIRDFCGMPMIGHAISVARDSKLFDQIVVSTDDPEIAAYACTRLAIVVSRPTDDGTIGTQEVAARALDRLDAGGVCCVIYPCVPLLDVESLTLAYGVLAQRLRSVPYVYSVGPDGEDAGCFYWGLISAFRARVPLGQGQTVTLPAERVCDINTPDDWARAESMFNALRRAP